MARQYKSRVSSEMGKSVRENFLFCANAFDFFFATLSHILSAKFCIFCFPSKKSFSHFFAKVFVRWKPFSRVKVIVWKKLDDKKLGDFFPLMFLQPKFLSFMCLAAGQSLNHNFRKKTNSRPIKKIISGRKKVWSGV